MTTKLKITLQCLMIMAAFSLAATSAQAQTEMDVNYTWTAPTSGSPVAHYVVEHSVDGGAWTQVASVSSNTYTLSARIGLSHRIRVAGVDAESRQGPFSIASDAYTPDLGSPTQPGKPIVF